MRRTLSEISKSLAKKYKLPIVKVKMGESKPYLWLEEMNKDMAEDAARVAKIPFRIEKITVRINSCDCFTYQFEGKRDSQEDNL